ncbi:MAG: hypothetical protein JSS60_04215 [Verrucomicrobia bacterium]|nr:hypothetical protein [Verrucomicrobiota bacterium]
MSISAEFTADHNGFYLGHSSFYPLVQEDSIPLADWSNTVLVRLPATLNDDLDWSKEITLAHQIAASGKYILWEIELGLASFTFIPEDSASFFSFSLAIEEFTKKVWPAFSGRTFGVVLYRGPFNPAQSFPVSLWETAFSCWQESSDYAVYCAQALSEYLHRLVSFLPDAALPLALIDVADIASPAKIAQLFSKERFEHLHLALKGAKGPYSGICWNEGHKGQGWIGKQKMERPLSTTQAAAGIYLPKDEYLAATVIEKLDALIVQLNEKQTPFRIVPEEKLTEQWDGLDNLIVPSSALSAQGKRKLLGFIAAGGKVLTCGEPIGLPDEESFAGIL